MTAALIALGVAFVASLVSLGFCLRVGLLVRRHGRALDRSIDELEAHCRILEERMNALRRTKGERRAPAEVKLPGGISSDGWAVWHDQ